MIVVDSNVLAYFHLSSAFTEALLDGAEHEPDSRRVLDLVNASNCTAYDCEFIAVATAQRSLLWTMDSKLIKAFPKITRRLAAG